MTQLKHWRESFQPSLKCGSFFFCPWQMCLTFPSARAWVNHEPQCRTSLRVLLPLSSFSALPWQTCVRWWVTYTNHLLSDILSAQPLNAKGKIYWGKVLLGFSWKGQTSSHRSAGPLTQPNISSCLSGRRCSLCLLGVKVLPSVCFLHIFLWVYFLFEECFVLHWLAEKAWLFWQFVPLFSTIPQCTVADVLAKVVLACELPSSVS